MAPWSITDSLIFLCHRVGYIKRTEAIIVDIRIHGVNGINHLNELVVTTSSPW